MKTIHINDIQIASDRQRREFNPDTLEELRKDIEEHGLYNAPVLREEIITYEDTCIPGKLATMHHGWFLVQGERRLRAMRDIIALGGRIKHDGEILPEGHIPYTELKDLDPLRAQIAEFHENMRRDNLTFQEECATVERIMALWTQIAEREGLPTPTVRDIMEEVTDLPSEPEKVTAAGQSHEEIAAHTKVRNQLIVARHLDDPDVKAAKSLRDAVKVVKRKEQVRRNEEIAKTVGATFSAALHQIHNADAVDWLAACPDGQFDVILTDPPYGMGADEFGDSDGKAAGAHRYEDSDEVAEDCYGALIMHASRITKSQAHLYAFCDIDWFITWRERLEAADWWVHRTPLIWHKPNGSRVPWPEHGPQRKYELILYAVKGKKKANGIYPDVISVPSDPNLGHQAQKPVALYLELLKRSARAGDTVLDPFAGSGPLLRAAHELKCIATLVEKDPASYGIILNRAKELK